jgi:pilus assembly protein CpaB
MRIRPQTVTLVVIAILFGLVAMYATRRYIESRRVAPEVPPVVAPKMMPVVVAQANLKEGATIRDADVAAVPTPVADVPKEAIRAAQRVTGRTVKKSVMAGEAVREQDLYELGKEPTLADMVPAGHRATTIRVDDWAAANGVIKLGSYVDLTLTFKHPQSNEMVTERLFNGLRVIALPTPGASQGNVMGAGSIRSYITLDTTPEQANRLILAQQYGTISVTLCSKQDGTGALADNSNYYVNKEDLLGFAPIPAPVRKVAEIYRGTRLTHVVFNGAGLLLATENAAGGGAATAVACPECEKKAAEARRKAGGGSQRPTRAAPPPAPRPEVPGPTPPARPNESGSPQKSITSLGALSSESRG